MNVQLGPLVESALSVRHTPPPAAAIQTRQVVLLQFGSMASAVTRPESYIGCPAEGQDVREICCARSNQVQVPILLAGFELLRVWIFLKAARVFKVAEKGM